MSQRLDPDAVVEVSVDIDGERVNLMAPGYAIRQGR